MTSPAKTLSGALEIGKNPRNGERYVLSALDLSLLRDGLSVLSATSGEEQRALTRLRSILNGVANAAA